MVAACDLSLQLRKSGKSANSLYSNGGVKLQNSARKNYPDGITEHGELAIIPEVGGLNCKVVYLTAIPSYEDSFGKGIDVSLYFV